jgi:uncharacterized lipoprotein YajG
MRRSIVAVVAAGLMVGCALSEDKVPVDYVPDPTLRAPVAGAANVTLSLTATDKRAQYNDRIGTKKNGYGMEMARIVSTNNVVDLVRTSLEQELKAEGFRVGEGGTTLTIEVQNFYNNFKLGLLAGTAAAEVTFTVKVRNAAGTLLYQNAYTGNGTVDDVMLAGGTNAKAAVEKALTAAVKLAADDAELRKVLLSTRPQAGPAGGQRV